MNYLQKQFRKLKLVESKGWRVVDINQEDEVCVSPRTQAVVSQMCARFQLLVTHLPHRVMSKHPELKQLIFVTHHLFLITKLHMAPNKA